MNNQNSQKRPYKNTKPGTRPNDSKKRPVPGSGKGKPSIYYNPIVKRWYQHETDDLPVETKMQRAARLSIEKRMKGVEDDL